MTAEAIIEFCRARLVNYKVPRRVVFVDSSPHNAMGKVQKACLHEAVCEGGTAFRFCPLTARSHLCTIFIMDTTLEIPQDILDSARLTLSELKIELAVTLYAQGRLSIGKARELAGMSLWQFRQLLGSRQIPPHYGVEALMADMATLEALEQE